MINIVKREPDKSIFKEIICRSCGVTLSYLPCDVKEYHGTDYSGGSDGREWIDCPSCSKMVTIRSW